MDLLGEIWSVNLWRPNALGDWISESAMENRAAERVVAFYNQRGTAAQHIKEGKNAGKRPGESLWRFSVAASYAAVAA